MNASLIQLASFQFSGARGSLVNLVRVLGSGGLVDLHTLSTGTGGGGGSAARNTIPIAIGSVVGGFVLMLAVVLAVAVWRRRIGWRCREGVAAEKLPVAGKHCDSHGGENSGAVDASWEGSGPSGLCGPMVEEPPVTIRNGDDKAAVAAAVAQQCAGDRLKISDEDSTQCTMYTISDLNSSDMIPNAFMPEAPPMPMPLASLGSLPMRVSSVACSVPEEGEVEADTSLDSSAREDGASLASGCSTSAGGIGRSLLTGDGIASTTTTACCTAGTLPSLLDAPADSRCRGGGGGGGSATAVSSGASARRMTRCPSGGRSLFYGLGEGGRPAGLRVRAVLGRSPSRPARSAASSSGGPAITLLMPQPAVLAAPSSPCCNGATSAPGCAMSGCPASAPPISSGAVRFLVDQSNPHRKNGRRREFSNPAMVVDCDTTAAVHAAPITTAAAATPGESNMVGTSLFSKLGVDEATATNSPYLIPTSATLDMFSTPHFDGESGSPGVSTSLSKVPEPASEVQRLIQELSTHGTDQLVILEPIGQGGYGMVYRGERGGGARAGLRWMGSPLSGPGVYGDRQIYFSKVCAEKDKGGVDEQRTHKTYP